MPTIHVSSRPNELSFAPVKKVKTLRELADEIRPEWKRLAIDTQVNQEWYLKSLAEYLDFDSDVALVTPGVIRKLQGQLAKTKKGNRKPGTINDMIWKGLKPLLDLALECDAISKSPLIGFKRLKRPKPIRLQPNWDQGHQIISVAEKTAPSSALMLRFMLYFGVGQAETKNVMGEHFDFSRNELHLFREKNQGIGIATCR